ncbi:hypothetical protein MUK42_06191 [Musa troglodytarum]|uniref:KAT8 regulatory NSL complex subunit 2 n=1 Tax=Musa troglodytarum TaxID=320322 RepID=A0A9E7H701_9LILI|nr:hypothetical protein MUK42_06191 [Musa troglodytarum]
MCVRCILHCTRGKERRKRREEIAMGVAKESRALRKGKSSLNPAPGAVPGGAMLPEVAPVAFTVDGADEDERLRLAGALAREEVLRRRSRRTKQLARCYRRQFWALMEEVRVKHRDFYWEHGLSPFDEGDDGGGKGRADEENVGRAVAAALDGIEKNGRARLRFGEGEGSGRTTTGERMRCAFPGCKSKAMPLTRFCHPHILADGKQKLYKACTYVTKSCGQGGPIITCGKPVLRVAEPSLCHVHFPKVQRSISKAFKSAGLNISSSSRAAHKFSVLIAECVRQIQDTRRDTLQFQWISKHMFV